MKIVREISPLTQFDCFTIVSKKRADFKFVLHNHEDMELNLILNASGAKRIIGSHSNEISDMELVFIGPNLSHGWMMDDCDGKESQIVTIRFQKDLLNEHFWQYDPLNSIGTLFSNSKRGVLFSEATVAAIAPQILSLIKKSGFDGVLNLLSILNYLSLSDDITLLSNSTFGAEGKDFKNDKIEKIFEFINNNYSKQISLSQLSKIANMPEVSLNNLLKKCTGCSFLDN
ncbi:MAG: AraC family transcriptional regulator, partial [Sphingobacteriaceae bacterium]